CGRERRTAPSLAPIEEGARRQLTALFADLAGYTSLSARHDPEQMRDPLQQFFDRVDGVTVPFRGSIHQRTRGASPALDGVPLARIEEGARRKVKTLFADLAGYTSLSASHDPEQMRDLLEQFFERVDGVTVSFGGSINQHIGDAILALFGAPVAHGNDAERAVA